MGFKSYLVPGLGLAPGCEAVALPRREKPGRFRAQPLVWAQPVDLWANGRTKGIAQEFKSKATAGHSRRLTSGGEAGILEVDGCSGKAARDQNSEVRTQKSEPRGHFEIFASNYFLAPVHSVDRFFSEWTGHQD